MLTDADFEAAYGPLLAKWAPILGEDRIKELIADVSPAIQGLLLKTAESQRRLGARKPHVDVIHNGIAEYDKWLARKGL
jgi:hypothetical protein